MKQYNITDADGEKKIIEQDNGVVVEILEKPSAEYISKMKPSLPEPEPRDYLAEIDKLKKDIEDLKKVAK